MCEVTKIYILGSQY
uniref:Uncharacterized protein n=1 Tax=Anguilla anguilla TaxID=7936 RepID=A0A0E9TB83_ANGAN